MLLVNSNKNLKQNLVNKVVHILWWDITEKPDFFDENISSWTEHNPEWTVKVWGRQECYSLLKVFYPRYFCMFEEYEHDIQRIDAIRYFILHLDGGLYADIDIKCNKCIDNIIDNEDVLFKEGKNQTKLFPNLTNITNSIMYSTGKSVFFNYIIKMLFLTKQKDEQNDVLNVLYSTGPGLVTAAHDLFNTRHVTVHPSTFFDEPPCIYGQHLYMNSWFNKENVII